MNRNQAVQLARNSFEASFVDDHSKLVMIGRLETYAQEAG